MVIYVERFATAFLLHRVCFPMRRLDRYIFREILFPGLIAVVALTFIVFSQRAGLLLDIIVRQSPTQEEVWAVVSALLPAVLTVTLPMALLVGILTGFGRMSSDREIIALRASGISMRRILWPVLVVTTLAWAVTMALTIWIAPQTTSNLRQLQTQIALKYTPLELRPRIFFESPGWSWVLYVNDPQRTEEGVIGRGILVVDTQNPDNPEFRLAESGNIMPINSNQNLQITLTNSTIQIVDPKDVRVFKILSFPTTNTIAIPMPAPSGLPGEAPSTEAATEVLWRHVRDGIATLEETVEFHRRLALPFACFSFALMGLPLGVSTNRGGRSTGLVLSLVLMFTYYLTFVGGTQTTEGRFSPVLGAWLPNIGFSVLGILLLLRSDRKSDNRVISAFSNAVDWVAAGVRSIKSSKLDVRGWAYTVRYRFRLFRLIDVYVLRGFWFFFAIVLSVFASVFIVVTLFEMLPDISRNKISASTVVTYFVFLMPQIIYWVVPLAVLLAILINLGSLTKTNEVLAVKAGAISLYRMSLPLILMGALMSCAVYVLDEYVLPSTNKKQDEYRNIIKGRPPQTYRDPARKLMMGSANQIYHYSFFDTQSNTFSNLTILTINPQTFQPRERLFAKRATWSDGAWTFENGWLRKFSDRQLLPNGEQMFERLSSYTMDAPDYFRREVPAADQMNYAQLEGYVEDLRRSGIDVGALTVDLYRKVSFPMVSLIMALIGVPFSFKTGRKGAFFGIGLCLAVGIFYWITFELFGKLGGINQLSPIVAAWFPNLIFGASGFWMMLRLKT